MFITCLIISLLVGYLKAECLSNDATEPIAFKDGDYLIAGLFRIGNLVTSNDGNYTTTYCDRSNGSQFGLQKAIAFRNTILEITSRYTNSSLNLGYAIYDTCFDMALTSEISSRIVNNPKFIGVSSVDHKEQMIRSAGITTGTYIPTFGYIYSDETLLESNLYPTMFSMIDTERVEAEVMISVLRELGYQHMDIWYHAFSKKMAQYIYQNHVLKQIYGCGRITEITPDDLENIDRIYNTTGGNPSKVQLILDNNAMSTMRILRYFVEVKKFTDTVYIFGMSVGRRKTLPKLIKILKETFGNKSGNAFIVPQSLLLNAESEMKEELMDTWSSGLNETIDKIYQTVQKTKCNHTDHKTGKSYIKCRVTSWLSYVSSGVKVLVQALIDTLEKVPPNVCNTLLKRKIYETILTPDRKVPINAGDLGILNVTFAEKQLSIGYEIDVYDATVDNLRTVGRAYIDRVELGNTDGFQNLKFPGTCSPVCYPGYRTVYHNVRTLPCCWECVRCDRNYFSTHNNSDQCSACNHTEISTEDNTGCRSVITIYIKSDSYFFICGTILVLVGFVSVILLGIYIYKREERPVIKASDPSFVYILLLCLVFGICAAMIPLLKPTVVTCRAEYICVVIFASLITSNLAWRCYKIYSVFSAANKFEIPKFSVLLTATGQTVLNCGLLVLNLAIALVCLTYGAWTFNSYQSGLHEPNYLTCKASNTFPPYLVGSPAFSSAALFLYTLFLAFKMRKFPHNFRETTNIFTATLVVILTCIMFLSGYSLSPPSIQPLLRSIVLYVTCVAYVMCLFVPKIIILMKNVDVEEEKEDLQKQLRKFSSKIPKIKAVTSFKSSITSA